MTEPKCIGDEPHVWMGFDHGWKCRVCGKPGVDCKACDGTGWDPEPRDDSPDEDCLRCGGSGVIPAAEAADEPGTE